MGPMRPFEKEIHCNGNIIRLLKDATYGDEYWSVFINKRRTLSASFDTANQEYYHLVAVYSYKEKETEKELNYVP